MSSKKIVLNLDLHDDRDKQKAMKVVSKVPCIDSITMDMKAMKLTVIGDIDPINVVNKLRRYWSTEIFSVGPAKEPEKKKDDKKDDPSKKKDEGKKEGGGGGGGGGGGDKKKESNEPAYINPYMLPYYQYPQHIATYNHPHVNYPHQATTHYPPMASPYYAQPQHEENPNGCVIC